MTDTWRPRHYYILRHTITGMMYIGQRINDDVGGAYLGSGKYWVHHRRKHGWKDVEVVELCRFTNCREAQDWLDEQYSKYGEYWKSRQFANLIPETTDDTASQLGSKHREETKQRMSAIRKGRQQMGGVKSHSESSRNKMSASRTGRTLSEEDRFKKSLAQRGKPKSEAHKQAMRKPKRKVVCSICNREIGTHNLQKHLIACEKAIKIA